MCWLLQFDVAAVRNVPAFIFNPFMEKFTLGLTRGFVYVLPVVVLSLIVVPFLSGAALRKTVAREKAAAAPPKHADAPAGVAGKAPAAEICAVVVDGAAPTPV